MPISSWEPSAVIRGNLPTTVISGMDQMPRWGFEHTAVRAVRRMKPGSYSLLSLIIWGLFSHEMIDRCEWLLTPRRAEMMVWTHSCESEQPDEWIDNHQLMNSVTGRLNVPLDINKSQIERKQSHSIFNIIYSYMSSKNTLIYTEIKPHKIKHSTTTK